MTMPRNNCEFAEYEIYVGLGVIILGLIEDISEASSSH
jgi:hypothetical protein